MQAHLHNRFLVSATSAPSANRIDDNSYLVDSDWHEVLPLHFNDGIPTLSAHRDTAPYAPPVQHTYSWEKEL